MDGIRSVVIFSLFSQGKTLFIVNTYVKEDTFMYLFGIILERGGQERNGVGPMLLTFTNPDLKGRKIQSYLISPRGCESNPRLTGSYGHKS